MAWVRIADEFPLHPKVLQAGPTGLALYVSGLCYANRYLTDGEISSAALPTLLPIPRRQTLAAAQKLVKAGLWEQGQGDGFLIHDYLDYQPSRATTLAKRATDLARKNGGKATDS